MGKPVSRTSSRSSWLALRPGVDDAAAGVEHRLPGLAHQLDGLGDGLGIALDARLVGLVPDVLGAGVGAGGELHVLGNVDHDGAGAAGAGDVERLVQDAREIVDVLHQPVVLGAGARDADRVALLEGVVADQVRGHLAGDAHDGNGIHQRVGEAGDGVGGAGPGGDQHHADLAGRARVAFRGVHRAALLAHQHVLDLLLLEQLVVDRQHGAAGIAEDVLDTLVGQRPDHHLGARHLQMPLQYSMARAGAAPLAGSGSTP